ncbi:Multidrug resistance efflux pump [Bradyrhizobium lablabi]|uniref:Multidrug resistance efflux pump n=1 Tax=Bradyrhizobium lablabi TaxID=722472 RepID=A0A1M7AM14_9BRAD|nr:HlyD family efflux transporter periplasmic adaptor subunit [Bradyrhizobium lablabi]SHL43832.1 Multidrug resistance efflux pump [Bradyrhizobium lablabi]
MPENVDRSSARETGAVSQTNRHPMILRVSSVVVASILSLLMLTAVVPPIVTDQSDRAVVDAPVTLLTSPIDGEIDSVAITPGRTVEAGDSLAQISNVRLDRGTLISLEEKAAEAREKLAAAQGNRDSDRAYLKSLDSEIANQIEQLKALFQSQIVELRARVSQSESLSAEKKALVDRQSDMVSRDAASIYMLKPTTQQYSAALHNADAENAKLNQKIAQLDALEKGIYVGDDLVAIGTLVQKRRDIDLDEKRMEIEAKELSAVLQDHERLIAAERNRLETLAEANIRVTTAGKILNVGAAPGRHVNAGDTVASLVDCDKRFVVAIFSYRQGQSMKVGTRVRVDGVSFGSGIVTAVLPKTSDKIDDRFAVPFPQTERRELYAIIAPDIRTDGTIHPEAAVQHEQPTSCNVGQWVTVTKDDGIVPSMSVTWRRLETLMTSWSDKKDPLQPNDRNETRRETGRSMLASAFRSASQAARQSADLGGWAPRTDAVVSR